MKYHMITNYKRIVVILIVMSVCTMLVKYIIISKTKIPTWWIIYKAPSGSDQPGVAFSVDMSYSNGLDRYLNKMEINTNDDIWAVVTLSDNKRMAFILINKDKSNGTIIMRVLDDKNNVNVDMHTELWGNDGWRSGIKEQWECCWDGTEISSLGYICITDQHEKYAENVFIVNEERYNVVVNNQMIIESRDTMTGNIKPIDSRNKAIFEKMFNIKWMLSTHDIIGDELMQRWVDNPNNPTCTETNTPDAVKMYEKCKDKMNSILDMVPVESN
jgi:hypothetical protein